MNGTTFGRASLSAGVAFSLLLVLSGCGANGKLTSFFSKGQASGQVSVDGVAKPDTSVRLVQRDVESPDVFQVTGPGLWDGRPSLGGVWVAHPGVKDPERVIIRNLKNGKFVIGALFRREDANPGPKLQVSSEAAAALGLLAGQPSVLNVTALRREEVPLAAPKSSAGGASTGKIDTKALDGPLASVAAAIGASDTKGGSKTATKPSTRPVARSAPKMVPKMVTKSAPKSAATPRVKPRRTSASNLSKPFIQIGIFNIEENAKNTAASLRNIGILPLVKKQTSRGKTFWRVLVGPATNAAERAVLSKKIKGIGFSDAYFVTN